MSTFWKWMLGLGLGGVAAAGAVAVVRFRNKLADMAAEALKNRKWENTWLMSGVAILRRLAGVVSCCFKFVFRGTEMPKTTERTLATNEVPEKVLQRLAALVSLEIDLTHQLRSRLN